MINYHQLKSNRKQLDVFIKELGKLLPAQYKLWTEQKKISFWINCYNALTLKVIIDNYPIKPLLFSSFVYPRNSIRQIKGVWDKIQFTIMGKNLTLNFIEHDILRPKFKEPRIHMALVCAALGCPPLRNEPYIGEKLDVQLDDQTRRFLNNTAEFRTDSVNYHVFISSIFKWFGEDFIERYGTDDKFKGNKESERAVLYFISNYVNLPDKILLKETTIKIKYIDYDWSLNEQK